MTPVSCVFGTPRIIKTCSDTEKKILKVYKHRGDLSLIYVFYTVSRGRVLSHDDNGLFLFVLTQITYSDKEQKKQFTYIAHPQRAHDVFD